MTNDKAGTLNSNQLIYSKQINTYVYIIFELYVVFFVVFFLTDKVLLKQMYV